MPSVDLGHTMDSIARKTTSSVLRMWWHMILSPIDLQSYSPVLQSSLTVQLNFSNWKASFACLQTDQGDSYKNQTIGIAFAVDCTQCPIDLGVTSGYRHAARHIPLQRCPKKFCAKPCCTKPESRLLKGTLFEEIFKKTYKRPVKLEFKNDLAFHSNEYRKEHYKKALSSIDLRKEEFSHLLTSRWVMVAFCLIQLKNGCFNRNKIYGLEETGPKGTKGTGPKSPPAPTGQTLRQELLTLNFSFRNSHFLHLLTSQLKVARPSYKPVWRS